MKLMSELKKNSGRLLILLIFFYVLVVIATNLYLFYKINSLNSIKDLSVKVPANVRLCINKPPFINYTCNSSIFQNQTFYCILNAIDEDNESVFFWDLSFITAPYYFNLTGNILNFTPNATQIGNYSFALTVWDSSNCQNNYDYQTFNLEVVNVNDPPILVLPIPNQTMVQDSSVSFDLDTYFYDYDNDPLTYTTIPTNLENINLIIDSNNVVTLIPLSGWSGSEEIIFIAWDPYYANVSSNVVRITVTPITQQTQEIRASGSGGGGSAGNIPECLPKWYCRPFGKCEPDNLRRRECYDLNNCSTNLGKPNLTEPCIFESTCFDGFKGPYEEGVDCGGPCPPCGTCYDNICNNNEDCTRGLTKVPDCGGPCASCFYEKKESCFDFICNNNEDCTRGLTDIPDCGGPCNPCSVLEKPEKSKNNIPYYFALFFVLMGTLLFIYKQTYPYLLALWKKKKRKLYQEKLFLEARISESIFESILKLEEFIEIESSDKLLTAFANIVRRFFKSLFNLNYEFTYEELINEIKSRKITPVFKEVLIDFFERGIEIEFSGKSVSKQEIRAMLSEFKQIVSVTSEIVLKDRKQKYEKPEDKLDEMFLKITQAENLLRERKVNDAYFIYLDLLKEFKLLSKEDKEKIHGFIIRLYNEIKLVREQYFS